MWTEEGLVKRRLLSSSRGRENRPEHRLGDAMLSRQSLPVAHSCSGGEGVDKSKEDYSITA